MTISKKALTTGFLISLMITLVAFVLISGTLYRFMFEKEDKDAEALCQSSVALRHASAVTIKNKIMPNTEIKVVPFLCKTIDKEIKPKGKNLEEEKESIKTQIANKMARCWWMFGEGRFKKNIFQGINIFGADAQCFTCYTLLIEDGKEFKEGNAKAVISPIEFKEFLREEKHQQLGMPYLEYFQNFNGGTGLVQMVLTHKEGKPQESYGIAPGRAYAVAYKAKKGECAFCNLITGAGSSAIGLGVLLWAFPPAGATITVATLIGAGVVAVTYGVTELVSADIGIDSIYLVDMGNNNLETLFSQTCVEIKGTGGE